MMHRVHNGKLTRDIVNSVLYEFDLDEIESPKELGATIAAEAILFGTLKASINKLIKKSKIDSDLTREIHGITSKRYIIRVIDDMRVLSFDSNGIIWISSGLIKLLTREELIATILHEAGHGKEKMKILYDHMTRNPKNPKKLRLMFRVLGYLLKSRGVKSDPVMMTRVYLLSFIMYNSIVGSPFRGLYKWSYADLAVQNGYWDEYESALAKINRYSDNHRSSKLANKIAEIESKNPGASENLKRDMHNTAGESSDNEMIQIKKLTTNQKGKPDQSLIRKFLRTSF